MPPTVVNDISRPPFRAGVDVPGAEKSLVLWVLHHKSFGGIENDFLRAVESVRVNDDIAGGGMKMLDAFQEDISDPGTLIASGWRVDYVFVSSNLWSSLSWKPNGRGLQF